MRTIRFQDANEATLQVNFASVVHDVKKTDTSLLFRVGGVFARLSYEGTCGWRLQANKSGYEVFDAVGAAQSLSLYMKEEVKDRSELLTLQQTESSIIVKAANGLFAMLSLDQQFQLRFFSVKGECLVEIYSLLDAEGGMRIGGKLSEQEAVFGGGERFDTVNRRGTKIVLETCDGWNNSSTSYIAIPLFFTSRGGGMFFNCYEPASIDFGNDQANVWAYSVHKDVLDCYFYADGSIESVLRGYSELSGYAYMPTPWMQGSHVCRYAPDFRCFEDDLAFDKIEDAKNFSSLYMKVGDAFLPCAEQSEEARANANFFFVLENGRYEVAYIRNDAGALYPKGIKGNPGGDSVKTIMSRYIAEDMIVDVASLEARGWNRCLCDDYESRKNKEDLIKSVDWLHAHGKRAMVYIAVGDVNPRNIGFKDEYLVHADVTYTDADGSKRYVENTTRIPWVDGTNENPDVRRAPDGSVRTLVYLDITNDEAVEWYFDKIWGELIDIGIAGVKIDFCEMLPNEGVDYRGIVTRYHWANPDKLVVGAEHHVYPTYFISAFYKRMLELRAAKGYNDGFMVFSRGGGIGSQRNPYMWLGDQTRCFPKMRDQLIGVLNSGLSGMPFVSYDVAGYAYDRGQSYHALGMDAESEIFARGVEFTAFTTNLQSHGDVRHAYEMNEVAKQIYRIYTRLRVQLIPYMQKLSKVASQTGIPPVRHLVLNYPKDANVYNIKDEFMLGDALLIAPVLDEGADQRSVYLPRGSWTNLLTGECIEGEREVAVTANIAQIPLFLLNTAADAEELRRAFGGIDWMSVKNWK